MAPCREKTWQTWYTWSVQVRGRKPRSCRQMLTISRDTVLSLKPLITRRSEVRILPATFTREGLAATRVLFCWTAARMCVKTGAVRKGQGGAAVPIAACGGERPAPVRVCKILRKPSLNCWKAGPADPLGLPAKIRGWQLLPKPMPQNMARRQTRVKV
jgi:hypothetical protein